MPRKKKEILKTQPVACPVDINNEFVFKGQRYKISEKVKQYAVKNKWVKGVNDNSFTNEAEMDIVQVVEIVGELNDDGSIKDYENEIIFLDQKGKKIADDLVLPLK